MNDPSSFTLLGERWKHHSNLGRTELAAYEDLPWSRRSYARDAYIVRDGEPATVCTLLVEGFAFRQKLVSEGARQIISIHIPGEFIDLQNGLLDVADHNVQSLGRSSTLVVPKDALQELISAHPAIRRAIWLDTLIDSSIFREWVVNVGRRDARTRIAHLLCELVSRIRHSGLDCGPTHDFPLTQEQLADATGLTPVHTNRTLQGLRRDGLITLNANRLTVLDWEELVRVGDFNERYLHYPIR